MNTTNAKTTAAATTKTTATDTQQKSAANCDIANHSSTSTSNQKTSPAYIASDANTNAKTKTTTATTTNNNPLNETNANKLRSSNYQLNDERHRYSADNDNNNDATPCLSKLTLSSSLHQLQMNDTNSFLTNRSQQQQQPLLNNNNNNNKNDQFNPKTIYECFTETNDQQKQNQLSTARNTDQKNSKSNRNSAKCNKQKQKDANLDTVHVVVGNEACDLDSAVSCLLMFHIISKMSDEINGKDKSRTLYIPLLNTTRDMLDSKCEVLWFLQKTLSIDKSFLTCKDDIDWKEIKRNGIEVLVTLVDHNYNEEFASIGRIVEIIDHHQIQNPKFLIDNHSTIRTTIDTAVGSCTTLIAERLFYIYAEHHVSDEILLLIYGTVLLDTICLSEKAKRFTRRDVYLLKKLDSLLGSKKPSRSDLYKSLVEIKNTNHELNFEKLMKRDLKIYKDVNGLTIGIASLFGMAAKEALGLSANFDLDAFFAQNKYEAFIIMGLVADPKQSDSISRDLVLISANDKLFNDLCNAFESDSSKLDVVIVKTNLDDPEECRVSSSVSSSSKNQHKANNQCKNSSGAGGVKSIEHQSSISLSNYNVRIWQQRNVTSSRKVVAPLILKVMHDNTTGVESMTTN